MDRNILAELIIFEQAEKLLTANPERLTNQEKLKFKANLMQYLNSSSDVVSDEVFDFLNSIKLTKLPNRHTSFATYLKNKYGNLENYKVLDVGAGRICHLSEILAKAGVSVVAMDPNIRLTQAEAKAKRIIQLKKEMFTCDRYAKQQNGTDVTTYDLLVGLEPCMATEHIIRQGLTHDKPFDVVLCQTNHDSLSGEKFRTAEEWFEYLRKISSEIKSVEYKGSTILTNTNGFSELPQMEKSSNIDTDEILL